MTQGCGCVGGDFSFATRAKVTAKVDIEHAGRYSSYVLNSFSSAVQTTASYLVQNVSVHYGG